MSCTAFHWNLAVARVYFNFDATIRERLDFKGRCLQKLILNTHVFMYTASQVMLYMYRKCVCTYIPRWKGLHEHVVARALVCTMWLCVVVCKVITVLCPVTPKCTGTNGSKLITLVFQRWSKLVAGDTQGRCTYTSSFSLGYYYSCWHIAMWWYFKGGVYWGELAELCSDINF